jgi:hypothetical protein
VCVAWQAYVHVLLSYPVILSNVRAYQIFGLWGTESCTNFLEVGA